MHCSGDMLACVPNANNVSQTSQHELRSVAVSSLGCVAEQRAWHHCEHLHQLTCAVETHGSNQRSILAAPQSHDPLIWRTRQRRIVVRYCHIAVHRRRIRVATRYEPDRLDKTVRVLHSSLPYTNLVKAQELTCDIHLSVVEALGEV